VTRETGKLIVEIVFEVLKIAKDIFINRNNEGKEARNDSAGDSKAKREGSEAPGHAGG